ncbi:DUF6607 family protein [Sphingomonas sp. ERG5]|uniref:DUF6607 family protein n=1 Tax=Sphingomonas sp. ERG5 TaxID=1381597 RepID=UPI00054B68E5|nr:DUF6607 family protein [Sphingomonas sp. ERG5]
MIRFGTVRLLGALVVLPLAAPAFAGNPPASIAAATVDQSALAADRAAILAMAGDYKVTFDFRETTPWRADYTPIQSKLSGGHESVRVVEDSPTRIVLQHLLVVGTTGSDPMVIKHWRQDWTYEPATVLTYAGQGKWVLTDVPADKRRGSWSQTVWQTDDSPRYGGWGKWTDEGGVRRWQSDGSWRPLARRDAVRKPPYDRYFSINRHSPSPNGWIHWQDNIKMGPVGGKLVPFVQESVLNTYVKDSDYDVEFADAYWTATKDYWAAVRAAWDVAITADKGVVVAEVADTGSASGERLMGYADDIKAGKLKTADAIAKARAVIAEVTRR